MRPLYVQDPVDCEAFERFVHAFLDEELAQADRDKLAAHLAACPACAALLEREASFDRLVRARMTREPLPEGLEARVRAGLVEAASSSRRPAWRRPAAVAALAASIVLALAVPMALRGRRAAAPRTAGLEQVAREATVVDLVCDQHGVPLEGQRACRQPGHVNALKLDQGAYWGIVAGNDASRDLAENPAHRGRRVEVSGAYYPAIQSIAIASVRDLEAADLYHAGGPGGTPPAGQAGPPAIDGLATLLVERRHPEGAARGDA